MAANLLISEKLSFRLDFLRGLAAQAVLLEHMLTSYGYKGVYIGSFGVVVFFVISGFLIHLSTLSSALEHGFSMREYISRRFFRIFTLYIPVVIICFAIDIYCESIGLNRPEKVTENSTVQNFIGSFLMLQQNVISEFFSQLLGVDWLRLKPYGSARPLWTVAVEWWIYIAYGFLFSIIFVKKSPPRLVSFKGGVFYFSLIVFSFNLISGIGHNLTFIWLLGALIAQIFYFNKNSFQVFWSGGFYSIFVFAFMLFFMRILHMYLSPAFGIINPYDFINVVVFSLFFVLFITMPNGAFESGFFSSFSVFIGKISYSLYLTHFTIISIFFGFGYFDELNIYYFFMIYMVCNIVAAFLYYTIDQHYIRVRDYFFTSKLRRRSAHG
ncbi:Acyltransferase [Marinobacterium lacunae]|uniref:Acyltransferase n=1 Tax=Marinobacterium lacunae TaxID=1232683 RepID=A0A081G0B9_9GAMM|nr:acyltransferase [Marinobacterium lacunae]KEA64224.1 Acyltransferase [Marinobacterium lacunae]